MTDMMDREIRDYVTSLPGWPGEVVADITANLYGGPYAAELPFTEGCREVREWALNTIPATLYWLDWAGMVEDEEPEGGEYVELEGSYIFHAVFGELAEYVR